MKHQVNDAQDHHDLPSWFDEVSAALAYSDHIVLSGNVGDLFPSSDTTQSAFKGLNETLWEILHAAGFEALLAFDPINGLKIIHAAGPNQLAALQALELPLNAQSPASGGPDIARRAGKTSTSARHQNRRAHLKATFPKAM